MGTFSGVAPGWTLLEFEDGTDGFTIINCNERRGVQYIHAMQNIRDGALFACFERIETDEHSEVHFEHRGWTMTFTEAEAWLAGVHPKHLTFIYQKDGE